MPTADDARERLGEKDVAIRAEAARDLAAVGDGTDVVRLLTLATGDKSPSVRIYTAAAVAGIVHRLREQGPLPASVTAAVMDAMRSFDPQINPSLLLALGALGPVSRPRLGRLLRDPHSDVRLAAVAALRDEAMSAAGKTNDGLKKDVLKWLASPQLAADASLDLCRLVGQAQWNEGADCLRKVSVRVRDEDGVIAEALAQLK